METMKPVRIEDNAQQLGDPHLQINDGYYVPIDIHPLSALRDGRNEKGKPLNKPIIVFEDEGIAATLKNEEDACHFTPGAKIGGEIIFLDPMNSVVNETLRDFV